SLVGELREDLTRGRGCGVAFGRPLVRPVDPQGEDAVGGRKSHVARGCARAPARLRGRVSIRRDYRTDRVNRDWQRCVGRALDRCVEGVRFRLVWRRPCPPGRWWL